MAAALSRESSEGQQGEQFLYLRWRRASVECWCEEERRMFSTATAGSRGHCRSAGSSNRTACASLEQASGDPAPLLALLTPSHPACCDIP